AVVAPIFRGHPMGAIPPVVRPVVQPAPQPLEPYSVAIDYAGEQPPSFGVVVSSQRALPDAQVTIASTTLPGQMPHGEGSIAAGGSVRLPVELPAGGAEVETFVVRVHSTPAHVERSFYCVVPSQPR